MPTAVLLSGGLDSAVLLAHAAGLRREREPVPSAMVFGTWLMSGALCGAATLFKQPAGIVLVREAGGVVTDLGGRDIGVEHSGVVAGSAEMAGWLRGVVSRKS